MCHDMLMSFGRVNSFIFCSFCPAFVTIQSWGVRITGDSSGASAWRFVTTWRSSARQAENYMVRVIVLICISVQDGLQQVHLTRLFLAPWHLEKIQRINFIQEVTVFSCQKQRFLHRKHQSGIILYAGAPTWKKYRKFRKYSTPLLIPYTVLCHVTSGAGQYNATPVFISLQMQLYLSFN